VGARLSSMGCQSRLRPSQRSCQPPSAPSIGIATAINSAVQKDLKGEVQERISIPVWRWNDRSAACCRRVDGGQGLVAGDCLCWREALVGRPGFNEPSDILTYQGGPPPTTQGLSSYGSGPPFGFFIRGLRPPNPPVPWPFPSSTQFSSSKTSMMETAKGL